jgi:hypothetical protein
MRRPTGRRVALAATVLILGLFALGAATGCISRNVATAPAAAGLAGTKPPSVRVVKLPYRTYGMARVVGKDLYVSVDSGTGLLDTLVRYDLGADTSTVLFSVPADIAWVTVNERWLVWESEKKLYAQQVNGRERRTLATGREAYAPALEKDMVAWVEHEEGSDSRIVTFNLRTGDKREIARTHVAEFYNNFLQIRNGKLLWTDIYDGAGHYVVHDLANGITQDSPLRTARFRYPGYALRSGDSVFSINFDRYDQWDWSTQQVGRYSIGKGTFTPITRQGQYINALVVGRDAVAVIDSEQRLLVGPAEAGYPTRDLTAELGASVDAIQISSDGVTAVAGRSQPERLGTTLYVFELR